MSHPEHEQQSLELGRQVQAVLDRQVAAPLHAHVSGPTIIGNALQGATLDAVTRAEAIALPILLIILLLVFRSPIAAAIPLVVGGSTVLAATGAIGWMTQGLSIDAFSVSTASMVGLALGVDYSLLTVSRFREELAGRDAATAAQAAARTAATAGRTVAFAGAALVVTLTITLAMVPGRLLLSALGGIILAALIGAAAGVLALPAVLTLLGTNVDRWRIGSTRRAGQPPRWISLPRWSLRHPALAAVVILTGLILLAHPAAGLETGPPDIAELPADNPARQDFEAIRRVVGPGWVSPFNIIVAARHGTITEPRRLSALEEAQKRFADERGVAAVVGPGVLARRGAAFRSAADSLTGSLGHLRKGQHGLVRLNQGLVRANRGMATMQNGLLQATRGSARLSAGTGRGAGGIAQLQRGLSTARAGAEQLLSGLLRAERGSATIVTGSDRLVKGSRDLERGLARLQAPIPIAASGARRLASGLSDGASKMSALRQPAQEATRDVEASLAALRAMTVGKADPQYAAAFAATARASAAVTGRNPLTGAPVAAGYDGLDPALATASSRLQFASASAMRLARGADRLNAGAQTLRAGARRLTSGTTRLQSGARRLMDGLRRLTAGGESLRGGLVRLMAGASSLAAGLGQLQAGTNTLTQGLGQGQRRSYALVSGLGRLQAGSHRIERGYGRVHTARLNTYLKRSPGLFQSGYFMLAALDGARSPDRVPATFAINLSSGGQAARIIVVPRRGANDPETVRLGRRLSTETRHLAAATGSTIAVGGQPAQFADFNSLMNHRLPLLILIIGLGTYLVLIPIFRSLLLPLIAVALNFLSVAAALGVLVLAFQGRHPLLGGPGYLDTISAVGIFAIVFGLSIDYQVFLIARMREERDNGETAEAAIGKGLSHTAGIVTGAAAIMTGVFVAFALADVATIREFGTGLTVAVLLDATIVRLFLLPALMRLGGEWSWWLPRALARRVSGPNRQPTRDLLVIAGGRGMPDRATDVR